MDQKKYSLAYPEYYEPLPDLKMALKRIGLDPDGDYSPSIENLKRVMLAYIMHVPYENLDIYDYKRKIDFSPPHLYEKFVLYRRGGYCYEFNGFFMAILEGLGYHCVPLSGRLLFGKPVIGPMSHRTTIVKIDGKEYLCDVGYGGGCAEGPVSLDDPGIQDILGYKFSIRHHDGGEYGDMTLVKHADDGTESEFYTVYKRPHTLLEFVAQNFFTSEHPDSGFKKRRVVRLRTETGSKIIDNKIYRVRSNGNMTESDITGPKMLYEILTEEFNMIVPRWTYSPDWPKKWE